MGYDALLDLAETLGISNTDISLDETLAIAFGARGRGNAAAHYEPLRQVINLTKRRGAGSLAHEWFHGFDHMLGTLHGCADVYATERPGTWPLAEKLVKSMRYVHDADGRTMGRTEYYSNSLAMDRHYSKSGGYWASNIEMAARAFAFYVADKLNGRSDYLVGHAETAETPEGNPAYPMGAERKAINAVFDEIFAELIADGVFRARRDVDRPKPLAATEVRTEPVWDVSSGAQMQLSFF